jgi:type IV secretion system protein VirB8
MNINIFNKGTNWESDRTADLISSRRVAWVFSGIFAICFIVSAVALAMLSPLRRTIPYVVKQDSQTGNLEILQPFDNRAIGNQELLNKYWAQTYVMAREQYNWYLVSSDYDKVSSLTDPAIFNDYASQYLGEKGIDKVFGAKTERRIKVLSVNPSPTSSNTMVVRFERTTISNGALVEAPTYFVANLAYQFKPKPFGPEAELIRNPLGYMVYAYRRDVELPRASLATPDATNTATADGG